MEGEVGNKETKRKMVEKLENLVRNSCLERTGKYIKNKTRQLDESEATGNQRYKDSVFSCYNQVNDRIFMEYLES